MVEIISMAFMMDAVQGNIGNMNAVSYKEIFPLIKDNLTWLGNGFSAGNAFFVKVIGLTIPKAFVLFP